VLALRHTTSVLSLRWELVAFQHQHLVEVPGEGSRGTQTGGTATEDDGGFAEFHPNRPPNVIHTK
jgi:hypothetical protein